MNTWRIWIITLLILALPVASMAAISNTHCINITQPAPANIELPSTDHCKNNNELNVIKDTSLPIECSCDCKDTLGCLNNSATGFALSTYIKPFVTSSISQLNIDQINQFNSFHSPPLIRPPITIS